LEAGLSQEQLGVCAGIEEASASTRMNRYERATRAPDVDLMQRIATVLNLPLAYFYSVDDEEARMLAIYHRLPVESRAIVLKFAFDLSKRS
jgi:transcriptional regulator with XRE-family HTH domain